MISAKRKREVDAKRSGPCVICGSLDGRPEQITDAASYTENNVLSLCPGCITQMRQARTPALDRLREIVHAHDGLYNLIGDHVVWFYENGRRVASPYPVPYEKAL